MDLVLESVRRADVPRIASMSRDLIEAGLPWTWRAPRIAAALRRDDHAGVVARAADDDIAGFCVMQLNAPSGQTASAAHLVLLAVAPDARRRGVGRRLVTWAEDSALCAGAVRVRLEVRATSQTARAFYRALGYVDVGQRDGYYSKREAAIVMGRALRSDAELNRARVRADALVGDAIARALADARASRAR